ncbi:hypothetical protein [Flexibacterium corallicola]|uniref:hypothetical protein n=1 Tax=Flexibacterium corallicola TaxID=3037259 RepID=UPI00286F7CCA|nr:hypothetical protein [Pseudovibrio sp. M1P-2-3]
MQNKVKNKPMLEATNHPYINWLLQLCSNGEVTIEGTDVYLSLSMAKRFGIGVSPSSVDLYCNIKLRETLKSVNWTKSSVVYNFKCKDWLRLICNKFGSEDSSKRNKVQTSLWIPAQLGRLDPLLNLDERQDILRLYAMKVIENRDPLFKSMPFDELDLTFEKI